MKTFPRIAAVIALAACCFACLAMPAVACGDNFSPGLEMNSAPASYDVPALTPIVRYAPLASNRLVSANPACSCGCGCQACTCNQAAVSMQSAVVSAPVVYDDRGKAFTATHVGIRTANGWVQPTVNRRGKPVILFHGGPAEKRLAKATYRQLK